MANSITLNPAAAPTMTSLELVEFINADRKQRAAAAGASFPSKGFAKLEHADFLKKVPEVLGERDGNFSVTFQVPGPNGATRQSKGYRFPKREACLLAMSYSYDLQAKVFDRMTALEATAPVAAPLNIADPHALRAALLGYAERVINLETKVAEQAPAVAAQELLSGADGSLCITDAAKALHQRPKDLFAWLSANKWIYRRAGGASWVGYQDRIQSGLVEHKTTTVQRSDGTEKVIEQVLIMAKGLDRLAKTFGAVEVAA
jgi:phage antirepressor YoqD-like protein